jgi:uncharacterized protein
MNRYFADTQFFVALINPRDQWHKRALEVESNLIEPFYITTEGILTEVLTFFCEYGEKARLKAVEAIELILSEASTEVITITHQLFIEGVELYKQRPDKGYSLTDCISMNICREGGISEILTHDHHFTQEGFTVLM